MNNHDIQPSGSEHRSDWRPIATRLTSANLRPTNGCKPSLWVRVLSRTSMSIIMLGIAVMDIRADEVDKALTTIQAAGPGGTGSRAARQAHDSLVRQGMQILPRLLQAMDSDNIVALNWYRSAYEQIVDAMLIDFTSVSAPFQLHFN